MRFTTNSIAVDKWYSSSFFRLRGGAIGFRLFVAEFSCATNSLCFVLPRPIVPLRLHQPPSSESYSPWLRLRRSATAIRCSAFAHPTPSCCCIKHAPLHVNLQILKPLLVLHYCCIHLFVVLHALIGIRNVSGLTTHCRLRAPAGR